ncbi:MAG: hypothetical protein JSW45_02720 [Thiotrichales bacterium]|nr:MAG: hypothetical protein JSW45_02720 [Thiotrichales bacterium]
MSSLYLEWPGLTADNTLIIDVDKSEFLSGADTREYRGKVFKPKHETHITVFGSAVGAALRQKMTQDPAVEAEISKAFENTDWSYTRTEDFRHLVKTSTTTTAQSIIVLLEMDGMAAFHEKLKALNLIDQDHPLPPPHVTLYTCNCDTGIGVNSESELEALTQDQVELPF